MSHNSSHQGKHPKFIGPVGGAITKHLVELGEQELQKETNQKKGEEPLKFFLFLTKNIFKIFFFY